LIDADERRACALDSVSLTITLRENRARNHRREISKATRYAGRTAKYVFVIISASRASQSARRRVPNREHFSLLFHLLTTLVSSFWPVTTEIGVTLTGLGALFLFLGVMFFFDRGLLAMGNVLFLAGVIVILGVQSAIKFFLKPKNYKGSLFFVAGVVLVVWGWTLVGFGVELYGMWGLFAGVFPAMLTFLRTVPGLKTLLDMPAVKNVLNRVAPAGSGLPV
jgi:hypothetical protein